MNVREKLLHAALRVFEEAGSRGATTRRIAAEAGVNEVTLFRHFGSKTALIHEALHAAARESLAEALPGMPREPAAELTEWARTHLGHLIRSRGMIRTCMGEAEQAPEMASCAGATPQRVAAELEGYLLRLRERGLADDEFDPGVAAAMLMGALFTDAMGRDIMPERFPFPVEEAPERYVRLFLRAIGAPPAPAGEGAGRAGRPVRCAGQDQEPDDSFNLTE